MTWRSSGRILLAVACAALLGGCPVPVPPLGYTGTSRDNLPDTPPAFIVKGQTTRADVLLGLGAPDTESPDGRWFAYRSERHTGGVVFVVGGPYSAGAVGVVGYEERLLTVRFDERSIAIDATLEDRVCSRGVAVAGSGAAGESPPCLKLPDLSGGPSPELSGLRTLHVLRPDDGGRDVDRVLAEALRRKGFEVSTGPPDAIPANVDAIVTCRETWTAVDGGPMAQLTLLVQRPGSEKALALASARQSAPARKTTQDLVDEVLANVFQGEGRTFLTLAPYRSAAAPPAADPPARATVLIEPVRDARVAPRGRFIGERSALGAYLGVIDMSPLPVEIVDQLLHAALALPEQGPSADSAAVVIDARLTRFEIRTPSTLVYWDVNGTVAVTLGVTRGGVPRQELRYEAACTERTYVWLSEELIARVVKKCLDSLADRVRGDPVLADLLAARAKPDLNRPPASARPSSSP